jgi:hypothetical protein
MKKCTYCGKEYPDDAAVCPTDQQPLEILVHRSLGEAVIDPTIRPVQVKRALLLWAIGAALNLVSWITQTNWSDWVMYPTFAIIVALSLLLLWLVYRGKNWVRWFLLVFIIFRVLMLLGALHREGVVSGLQVVWTGSTAACQVVAVCLLFSRASRAWFRASKVRGNPAPALEAGIKP